MGDLGIIHLRSLIQSLTNMKGLINAVKDKKLEGRIANAASGNECWHLMPRDSPMLEGAPSASPPTASYKASLRKSIGIEFLAGV